MPNVKASIVSSLSTVAGVVRTVTPQTLDSWGKFIVKVGAWAVLAGYLVLQVTGDLKTTAGESLSLLQDHVSEAHQTNAIQRQILEYMRRQSNVLAQQCVNLAGADDGKRDRCFDTLNGASAK